MSRMATITSCPEPPEARLIWSAEDLASVWISRIICGWIIQQRSLPQWQLDQPEIAYPSGGAVQRLVGLWWRLAPSLNMIRPENACFNDRFLVREAVKLDQKKFYQNGVTALRERASDTGNKLPISPFAGNNSENCRQFAKHPRYCL